MGGRQQQDHHGVGGGAAHHIPQHQVGGRQQQDHHGVGGQLIIFHNTRWRDVVEEERKSLQEESTPEGWFFLKNSERMFRKSESEMSADHLFVFE